MADSLQHAAMEVNSEIEGLGEMFSLSPPPPDQTLKGIFILLFCKEILYIPITNTL